MFRFFCPDADFNQETIHLTNPKEIYHLKNVLRLKVGDSLRIFNGHDQEAEGRISSLKKNQVEVTIGVPGIIPITKKDKPAIILACAIPKKGKFETIIEKTTELGVDEIIPVKTQRTEFKLSQERLKSKQSRFQSVAINAAKQSRRITIPQIRPVTDFFPLIKSLNSDELGLIACLSEKIKSLFDIEFKNPSLKKIIALIGPEGDFTLEEISQAKDKGFIPISLGANVLKVDTAAICVVAYLNLFFSKK